MNTHQHSNEARLRRRTPLHLAAIPRPDVVLPEGYTFEEVTGVGWRVVVVVDAVAVGAC